MADRLHKFKLDKSVSEELEGPAIVALWRVGTGKNNKPGFHVACYLRRLAGAGLFVKSRVKSFPLVATSEVVDGPRMNSDSLGHFII